MLRILDANLNRAREGLRVLEDIARFLLDDREVTPRLRALRHALGDIAKPLTIPLLDARRAADDIVGPTRSGEVLPRTGIDALVAANARRVAESLRVLEECAKLPDAPSGLDAQTLERGRFEVYELERLLMGRVARRERSEAIRGVYVLIDPSLTNGRDPFEVARQAIAGGVQVIQWRDKASEKGLQLPIARQLRELCRQAGVIFLINDHPDLAAAVDADGVHLGQKDLPLPAVRRLLRMDKIIGVSTATVDEARVAASQGADYIAVGAMFATQSKDNTRPAGLETLRLVRAAVDGPLVAIGGINAQNAGQVTAAGADAVAVINAVTLADDVRAAVQALKEGMAAPHDRQ